MRASARSGSASHTWSTSPGGDVGAAGRVGRHHRTIGDCRAHERAIVVVEAGRCENPAHGDWRRRVATVRPSVPAPTIATWRWLRPRTAKRPQQQPHRDAQRGRRT